MKSGGIKIKNEQDDDKKKRLIFIIIGIVIALALAIVLPLTLTKCSATKKYTYGNPIYTWATDYLSCTAERVANENPNYKETETVDSTYQVVDPAKCEEDGTGRYTATFTNEAFETQSHNETIPALGHDLIHHNGQDATCTESGWAEYDTCSRCDYSSYQVIPAKGHTAGAPVRENEVSATCTEDGSYESVTYCVDDGVELSRENRVIPALGHAYGAPTYEWSADNSTCTGTIVCAHDASHVVSETVSSTYQVTESAKCVEDGTGRYTATFTNAAFTTQTSDISLPATGHDWGTPTYEWSADNTKCTATVVCSHDATHVDTETVNVTRDASVPDFDNPDTVATITADFTSSYFDDQTKVVTEKYYGQFPIANDTKTLVKYGLYPQTHVNDSDLVTALNELTTPESNGWYLYNDEYYAKLDEVDPHSVGLSFNDGEIIASGEIYWFKCEPIVWDVLSNDDGEYFVLSHILLDAHRFGDFSNNYANSEIRSWLNNDFYNSAFALGNSNILTTTVDNSAATTDSASNPYTCDNTQDKVFLPSYQDYINSDYGFSASALPTDTRLCENTDWTVAREGSSYPVYYSRSISSSSSSTYYYLTYIWFDGGFSTYPTVVVSGVRPAITINIA